MLLLSFLLPVVWAHEGQAVDVRHWRMDDGLPQSTVTSIDQAPGGLLVLGTFGGLVRFDGLGFDVWDGADANIASIRVTAVDVAADGTTWFGTQDGHAYRMDRQGRVTRLDAPFLGVVWDVESAEGEVWWGCDAGLFRGAGDALQPVHDEGVWRLTSTPAGMAWVADDGVWLQDGAHPRRLVAADDLLDLAWRDGELLVGGREGLFAVDPDRGQRRALQSRPVEHIAVGQDGETWLAYGMHAWTLDGTEVAELPAAARSLFVDREGSLWAGAVGEGLLQFHEQVFTMLDDRGAGGVLPLPDGDGYVRASCLSSGESVVMRHIPEADELLYRGSGCIRTLAFVDGALWVGDRGAVVEASTGELVAPAGGSSGEPLALADDGRWLGTTDGLYRREGERWSRVPDVPGPVAALVLDDGTLWVGAADGVYRHDAGAWTAWNRTSGMQTTPVRDVWPHDGGAWVGTYGSGLHFVSDAGLARLTTSDGLAENVVSRIVSDGQGFLWLLGNRGVSRVAVADLDGARRGQLPQVRARLFLSGEGAGGNQPAGAFVQGHVLMPTVTGLVSFDLAALPRNEVPPNIVPRRAVQDGEDLLRGGPADGPGMLWVSYTLGSLAEPRLARFRYRLDAEPWVEVGEERELSFLALPSGKHRLAIIGTNEDGMDSPPYILSFEVPTPWREQWSLRALVAAVLVGMGFLLRRSRTVSAEKAAQRLQEEVRQREEAEALAHQRGAHYRRLFEAVGDGLLLCDARGSVVEANTAARELFRSEGTLPGQDLMALLGTVDDDGVTSCVRPDGTRFPGEVSSFDLQGGGNLISVRDLTNQRRAAEAQRLEAIGRLAGGVAHDVNNLLTALAGVGTLLREEVAELSDPREALELIDDLEQCVDRGGTLTRELMAFGRRQMLSPQQQEVQRVIKRVAPLLQRASDDDGCVQIELSKESLYVVVDASQLELAVLNLVLNAVAALRPGGRVHVRVFPEDASFVCIEVADDGAGIPPDVLPHIYEPFFTTRQSGTGLGLPSVHGFVAQSGGRLECRTQLDVGTTFRILLPRTPPPRDESRTIEAAVKEPAATRVLVCDDDPTVLKALQRMLAVGGYGVVAFSDPLEAVQQDLSGIDLLLSDVSMPGLRGPELAAALRGKRPELPVLYVSGFTEDIDLSTSPAPLLHKPFSLDDLLEAIAKALEHSHT